MSFKITLRNDNVEQTGQKGRATMWFLSRDVPGFCATVAKELGIKASEELSFYTPSGEFLETDGLVRAFIRADNENSMANLSKWGICNDEDSVILSVSSKAAEPGATKVRPPKKRFEVWQPDCGARVITYGLRTANDGKLIGRLASKSLGEHVESQVEIAFNWIENSIYKNTKMLSWILRIASTSRQRILSLPSGSSLIIV
eukprot:jgi/Botrbrau1/6236/Bobra.0109s0031.1